MKNNFQTQDNDLIDAVQANPSTSNNELQELIERHSGIYMDIVNNYIPTNCNFLNKSDILEEKNYRIYLAALKYDEDKGAKFSTYLGNETKWMCLNLFNKNKKHQYISIEEERCLDKTEQSLDEFDQDFFDKIISLAEQHPDARVFRIFKNRYIDGNLNKVMSWQKIAKNLDMSIQGCINIHNSALEYFKNKLNKEINNVK